MTCIEQYRAQAHACLQHANQNQKKKDIRLWLTLAQSWLRLAEYAGQIDGAAVSTAPEQAAGVENVDEVKKELVEH